MSRIDQIKARVAAATPGPWYREYGDVLHPTEPDPRDFFEDEPRRMRIVRKAEHIRDHRDQVAIADADFISNAREDIPWLLAEIERLEAGR